MLSTLANTSREMQVKKVRRPVPILHQTLHFVNLSDLVKADHQESAPSVFQHAFTQR